MEQYQPLFLKYRPQSLADLVGQRYVVLTLSNAIKHDRISHAYLFTGPRGTGKTSSARILAKSLNCHKGPTTEPCLSCSACVEIKEGVSPAVMEIDAASNNSVDDARVLIERAPLLAPGGRYKMYIIDECHMLTKEAFNALLKTIEEPPPNVIFILATTEEHKVPPTIHSRCQRLMFRLINQTEMGEHLGKIAKQESIAIDPPALEMIARHSEGGLRDALGLLDQASLLSTKEHTVSVNDLLLLVGALGEDMLMSLSKSVIKGDAHATLSAINQLLSEGKEPHLIASELASHFLNLAKANCIEGNQTDTLASLIRGSNKYIEELVEFSKGLNRAELAQMVESLDRLELTCKRSSQPALNLEVGLLSLCHRLDPNNLKAIEERIVRLESQFSLAELEAIPRQPQKPMPKAEPDRAAKESEASKPDSVVSTLHQARSEKAPEGPIALAEPVTSPTADPEKQSAPEPSSVDLDEFWSQLLEELQKRHLPTFSLVSTHAVPAGLSDDELTVGVMVENFQKMIESKIDHLQAAATAVTGKNLKVKVRIVDQSNTNQRARSRKSPEGKEAAKQKEVAKRSNVELESNQNTTPVEASQVSELNTPLAANSKSERSQGQGLSHLIQDAYRLFEGPGSRLITANQ
jgi:DNA polymerase-3 subunit gamma/tau